jgi:hypothetical protein
MRWPWRDDAGELASDAEVDAIVEAARAGMLTALDTALDTEAALARVYARNGQPAPERPAGPEAGSQLAAVCDRIGMLESALAAATAQGPATLLGVLYLKAVRRIFFELRAGLAGYRLDEDEALRLLGSAWHNIREATRVLRLDQPAADEAIRGRMSELQELAAAGSAELETLHHEVKRLFDSSGDTALIPVG